MEMMAWWFHFLLRFKWRHRKLGCLGSIGVSNMGETMWNCRLHDRVW